MLPHKTHIGVIDVSRNEVEFLYMHLVYDSKLMHINY